MIDLQQFCSTSTDARDYLHVPQQHGALPVPTAAHEFTKGQQVVAKTVSTQHAVWRQKYEGMTGTVKAVYYGHPKTYEVTFKGRTGGVADFTADELESV